MVERFPPTHADRFTFRGTAREHQWSAELSMGGKPPIHLTLIVRAQVKEAVPGQNTPESPVELQRTHVRHKPHRVRKACSAECDHGRRSIHTNDPKPAIDEVASDRLADPAAQVEHRRAGAHVDQEPIQPRAFLKRSAAVAIVLANMTLVYVDNDVFAHGRRVLLRTRWGPALLSGVT